MNVTKINPLLPLGVGNALCREGIIQVSISQIFPLALAMTGQQNQHGLCNKAKISITQKPDLPAT